VKFCMVGESAQSEILHGRMTTKNRFRLLANDKKVIPAAQLKFFSDDLLTFYEDDMLHRSFLLFHILGLYNKSGADD
jgi:hypothetical protein